MNDPSAERPFFETADRVRASDQPPASRAPVIILAVIALVLHFVLQAVSGEPADLLPEERTGAITFTALSIFVFALVLAGLGSLALIGTAARRYRQRTWGEDFGWLFCAALLGGGIGLGVSMALAAFGGVAG